MGGFLIGRFGDAEIGQDGVELTAQLAAGVSAENFVEPAGIGFRIFGCNNLDDIALLEFGFEVDHFAVNDGASTLGADFTVQTIGKIKRHGTFGEVNDVAFGGINEDFIGKEVEFELFGVDFFARSKLGG